MPPEMKSFHFLPAGPDSNERFFSFPTGIQEEASEGKRLFTGREQMWEAGVEWGYGENNVRAGEVGDNWSVRKDEHRSENIRLKLQVTLNGLAAGFFK